MTAELQFKAFIAWRNRQQTQEVSASRASVGRLAQMLQYFPRFIRFALLKKKKRRRGAEGRKCVLAQPSGLRRELSRTLKCTEEPGGNLEPRLIAFPTQFVLLSERFRRFFCLPFLQNSQVDQCSSTDASAEAVPGVQTPSSIFHRKKNRERPSE